MNANYSSQKITVPTLAKDNFILVFGQISYSCGGQYQQPLRRDSEIYVLQTIQMKLILLCVWAERAILGSAKTALKFKYEIQIG